MLQFTPTPVGLTRTQLSSFLERELVPALEEASRGSGFVRALVRLLERVPEKLYEPVTEIATPSTFKSRFGRLFGLGEISTEPFVEQAYRRLLGKRGVALYRRGELEPFLIGLNPSTMRVTTPLHEMFHYFFREETLSPSIYRILERELPQARQYQLTVDDILSELASVYIANPRSKVLDYIRKLPSSWKGVLADVLERIGVRPRW